MSRPPRKLRALIAGIGLAVYLITCSFGHAGYVLCTESDGRGIVESPAAFSPCCPLFAGVNGSPAALSAIDDCVTCIDKDLSADEFIPGGTVAGDRLPPPTSTQWTVALPSPRPTDRKRIPSVVAADLPPSAATLALRSTILLI